MRSRRSENWSNRLSSTWPTVAPSASASASPPVTDRSWAGIFTVTDMSGRNRSVEGPGERLQGGLHLEGLEAAPHRVEGLQPLAGDVQHHALGRIDVSPLGQLGQDGRGHAARGLGEDAGGSSQEGDASADLVVADRIDAAAAAAGQVERVGT